MTTNSPNPVDGDVQALIEWLKPQISELENICDELPFGLDEDDEMQLKVMRFALERLNATAQPVSDWQKEAERMAELHGMSFVVFRNGDEPKCADPTKVRIEFTDKGLGYPAAPGGQDD
ncbi:hypothetical protein C1N58_12650 [Pantoea sp. SGAir0180]